MSTVTNTPRSWSASFVAPAHDLGSTPWLRRRFVVDDGHGVVVSATWHVSAHGLAEPSVDGVPVSDEVLAPGWSAYEWRLRYRSHDVTALLPAPGSSCVLSALLGRGWFAGKLGFVGESETYGSTPALVAELEIGFADGHVQTVVTDEEWQARGSHVLADDLYDGQSTDLRLLGRDPEEGWGPVRVVTCDGVAPVSLERLVPAGPPVRRQQVVSPVRVWTSPSGRRLVDFGQNLVGWVRLRLPGSPALAGTRIVVRHAEVLEDAELGTRPLRLAAASDTWVLAEAPAVVEPTLTFHGFRYAEVTGWPEDQVGALSTDDLEAVVVHTDLARTGRFRVSDPDLQRLHDNVVWGMRGNFLDLPTDCPQRDERLGWTGDLAVFAPTAAFLFDTRPMLTGWLADLAVETDAAKGVVPFVVPDALKHQPPPPGDFPAPDSAAIWSDAAVWVPWALYEAHGDTDVLEAAWPTMLAHVEHVATLLDERGLWGDGFQFGDWLDPGAPPEQPFASRADIHVVATAALIRTLRMVAASARALGHDAEADDLADRAAATLEEFREAFAAADGTITSDCQTVYALAIAWDLLTPDLEAKAGERLATLVREADWRISTGFAGTPYVTHALTRTGHLDDAYRLLLQRECPSWLYAVTMGATTIWERWDSMLPDGTINPGEMTSFNHYALGSVADWLHRTVGGLAPAAPGYSSVLVAPRPGGGLTWAETTLETAHDQIRVAWRIADGVLTVTVDLPTGVDGVLDLPGRPEQRLAPGSSTQVGVPA
ncbi:alpha-L-rhamnosidase [Nocardioides bruguierae]|uniref:alpha-L-rhamnosidase n=1 Tax=Nocardioides bruguierae TaxID=2945102 RepID=A0A9X2DBA0_9ACTN|nr:alpha-L-rhamnosidase [Nocardioides bruguierae]MCM0621434.1 glycoside hydrolase family 78 protein [Nocardioides bruguierae]